MLVVDDNTQIHDDFRKALGTNHSADELQKLEMELFGEARAQVAPAIDIVSCHQGEEARDRVAQELHAPFALAFVDIRMPPGWDGIRTVEELWRVDPRLEIVICSAHSDYSWEDVAGRIGGTDQLLILKKPFELIEIRQIAYALTRKWNLSRETEGIVQRLELEVGERTATLAQKASELEIALADLRRTQTDLIQSGRLTCVAQLAAGVAHEINTPMQFIGDNIRFLRESFAALLKVNDAQGKALSVGKQTGLDAALVAEVERTTTEADLDHLLSEVPLALGEMQSGVRTVVDIVRSMKDFARPDGTQFRTEDLNRAIESAVTVTRGEWKETAVVTLDLAADLPEVPCLLGELQQVILNLLTNAVDAIAEKAGTEKGEIRIRTSHTQELAEIRISDNGCGIPAEIRSRVFDPFFTTKEVGKGTGQGLAIAWNVIVRNHHGSLDLESEVGRGTTFILRLPLHPESTAADS